MSLAWMGLGHVFFHAFETKGRPPSRLQLFPERGQAKIDLPGVLVLVEEGAVAGEAGLDEVPPGEGTVDVPVVVMDEAPLSP